MKRALAWWKKGGLDWGTQRDLCEEFMVKQPEKEEKEAGKACKIHRIVKNHNSGMSKITIQE